MTGLDAGVEQDTFDRVPKPARLGLDARAVLLDPRRVHDQSVGQVLGGRADHRHRRPQLV